MFKKMYLILSKVFPSKIVEKIHILLIQSGFENMQPKVFLGFMFFFSLCLSALFFLISSFFFTELIGLVFALIAFFGGIVFFYILLITLAESRARKIELVLPDVLQIISANIKAGMTLENAIWISARPEFGPLQVEIKKVSADTYGGKPIGQSLQDMAKRVRSKTLERSIKLIVEGIRLGGEMANLLNEVAADIRSTQFLQKEIATATMMYTIFIIFAAVLASPFLFSIATFYSEMTEKISAKQQVNLPEQVSAGGMASLAARFTGTRSIPSEEIKNFAVLSIVITNIFAGFILGLIQRGKALSGIKYVPIFVFVSLGVFFLASFAIRTLIGGMMGVL